ncbi:asialoglycoprotein receptor 2-like [Saccopteryx leptura]|uniref:asialoglycoprotein receptor 2-like n=1 Tax=Saccopteryx leptura TaxID=249018 RepID=UPI00339BDBC0
MQVEFWTLKEAFSNFSSSTLSEIRALGSHGGSIGDSVTSLEARLEKQEQDLKEDHATLLFHLKHFPADLRILACQMAFLRSNGTECCPVNWLEHEGSCYWFSRSGLTGPRLRSTISWRTRFWLSSTPERSSSHSGPEQVLAALVHGRNSSSTHTPL